MKVLTQSGFRNFDAIISKGVSNNLLKINFDNGENVTCTQEHQFLTFSEGYLEACFLEVGDLLYGNVSITSIETVIEEKRVYDLLNVEETHSYYTNGVISHNCIYIDEFAFVPTNIAEEFFTSVYPTISSGETSKIFISSTPNGMNHFYKMWTEAIEGKNGFIPFEANWRDVPGRDEVWAEDQRRALGDEKFNQEMETAFIGSAGTLISSTYLKKFNFSEAIKQILDGLDIYENPEDDHSYVITVDTARGNGLDSSAFIVVDVSVKPYNVVAKYKNNYISPYLYPNIIYQAAKYYNEAYILVENNDTGGQVADTLYNDLEYENMFFSESKSGETELSSKTSMTMGIRTTSRVKTLGCNALKSLIESKLIHFTDFDIISELSCFVLQKNGKYAAEKGKHDDLVICLILFAWVTMQPFFRDLTDNDIRKKIYEDQMKRYEDQMIVPIFSTELDQFEDKYGEIQTDSLDGDLWFA
jgi:hypothetical protein